LNGKKNKETFITKCFFKYAPSTHSNGGFIFPLAFSNSWLMILIKQKLWESDAWSVKGVNKMKIVLYTCCLAEKHM